MKKDQQPETIEVASETIEEKKTETIEVVAETIEETKPEVINVLTPETVEEKPKRKPYTKKGKDVLKNDLKTINESVTNAPINAEPAPLFLISGKLLLLVIDGVIPTGVCKVGGMFSPKLKKANIKDLKLDKDDIKELTPIADEVAKSLTTNLSPLAQLICAMGALYVSKATMLDA